MALALGGWLLLAVFLVFGQTLRHGFVNYDDPVYVYENPRVTAGLHASGVAWALTAGHANNWHPLTWLSHMADCQLYGLDARGHHLTNLLLHAAVAILLLWVLWQMTGHLWPSALVAALFAVHPLRVESVAWLSERKDLLSGLFFVLTLAAYLGYVRRPHSLARYLTVFALLLAGLMSKPVLVTLPCLLLLLDYWPLGRIGRPATGPTCGPALATGAGRSRPTGVLPPPLPIPLRRVLLEKVPLVLLAAAFALVTLLVQGKAVAALEAVPMGARLANALLAYVAYLGQFFYPIGLAVFYPYPSTSPAAWKVVGALLLLAGISAAAVRWRRSCPYLFVGWFWYLGMLVPMIGLVQIGAHCRADRYTYLPQIGLAVALVWGAASAAASRPRRRWAYATAAVPALWLLIGCAWQQTSHWRDSETLWNRALACTSRNHVAHNDLGIALARRGEAAAAISHYRKALEIAPDFADAHYNLALALADGGKSSEAIDHFEKALARDPDFAAVHNHLGRLLARCGRPAEAAAHLRQALKIDPDSAHAHNNSGNLLAAQGHIAEAIVHYQKALEIDPRFAEAHFNLGVALAGRGHVDEAAAHYRQALAAQPDLVDAHYNLGAILARRGQTGEAVAHFERAVAGNPDHVNARYNLGLLLHQQGKTAEALRQWREAIQRQPNDAEILNQLAWTLATAPEASLRRGTEAIALARRANQLCNDREPIVLRTLAAAYAEAGQFAEAVQVAQRAVPLASARGDAALVKSLQAQIGLYQAGSPYRETSGQLRP
jgi:protein O-mannosyl-transferase